ncbi:MAG: type I 3-dehydroquinate dehydratase [Syntrophorhabdaceae bacterium]|nr:type I 3-dehydroquinate dehydratase [Syntrophorhabdaceae bacterium]
MICVSLSEKDGLNILKEKRNIDLAEIRMDRIALTLEEVREVFSMGKDLIATYRPDKKGDENRLEYLLAAIEAGARYVDIELEMDDRAKGEVIEKARSKGCKVILSFHDYEKTPPVDSLKEIINLSFGYGADIVKISCKVNTSADNIRLLGLFGIVDEGKRIIVIGMGDKGRITRVASLFLGSPFTFVAPEKGKESGDGQFSIDEMETLLELIDGKRY